MLDDDHGDGVHNHLCPYITIILEEVIGKQPNRKILETTWIYWF